jgi:LPXTG-site transpeptidase (sortase) family protein
VFSEPVINFVTGDVALSGTAGATTATVAQIAPNDDTTYSVAVSGMTLDGTVIVNVNAGVATDAIGNPNMASASTDNQVTFSTDVTPPSVLSSNPASGSVLLTGSTQIIVQFSEDVKNDSSTDAADNTSNFLLVASGADLTFETVSCLIDAAVTDVPVAINAAAYQNKITTLDINGGTPLSAGSYSLFICGTTSIEDLVGNKLNNGADDSRVNFSVSRTLANSKSNWNSNSNLPATGFPVGRVTHLPVQTADKKYAAFSDFWLEIPKLTVSTPIVGVPLTQDGWDVTWLGQKAGWLNETAFPSWAGNSVITAHVWDAYNQPGIFYNLKDLQYGDLIKVHAFGQIYIYEVRQTKQIAPDNFFAALKHEDKAWLTLLTCEDYMPSSQIYSHRRMVRAVWVSVASEK